MNEIYNAFKLKASFILVADLVRTVYHRGMATQDDYIKTALRLPRSLHAELLSSAESKGRSLNAELIDRLSKSPASSEIPGAITALAYRIAQLEVDLQTKQLDVAELANSLESALLDIRALAPADSLDSHPYFEDWKKLVAKFSLSVPQLQELGRQTDDRFNTLMEAAKRIHGTPPKKTPKG